MSMPDYFKKPLNQSKMGTAMIAACIVQTLSESDPTFQKRFLDRLEAAYGEVRHDCADVDCLEMMTWLRQMLESGDLRFGHQT